MHIDLIRKELSLHYPGMLREAGGAFEYPFFTPGSEAYPDVLWDWDSWLSNVALRQILRLNDSPEEKRRVADYERGCILNYLTWCSHDGWIPIAVARDTDMLSARPKDIYKENMHKPCLAQHAAFLVKQENGDAEWLREKFGKLQVFLNNYHNHHRHPNGLYFWQDDRGIGVDNDPCTYYRPPRSSGSIYLNCLMYKELKAMAYLCDCLGLGDVSREFESNALELRTAIRNHCWDERDGFYYSVDLNLNPIDENESLHSGMPRHWDCLIQRIGVWSGFLAMWAGIADDEQAARMVEEHYRNTKTFNAPYGVRTLSKMERMYCVRGTGNPSCWLGPVWGAANYLVWRGLLQYGFEEDARDLAEKTIKLFGMDLQRFGTFHEYYQPDDGEPVFNQGFQSWNYLVLNMIDWYEGKPCVSEF
ncbi:MAG: MGH1-like glycoside hydrolase domain-containing protein [Armatimonadota bacterium]